MSKESNHSSTKKLLATSNRFDLTGDGEITIGDVFALSSYISGDIELKDIILARYNSIHKTNLSHTEFVTIMDTNGDTVIDINDAKALLDVCINLESIEALHNRAKLAQTSERFDLNGDGNITIKDSVTLSFYITGDQIEKNNILNHYNENHKTSLNHQKFIDIVDTNGDTVIDFTDASALLGVASNDECVEDLHNRSTIAKKPKENHAAGTEVLYSRYLEGNQDIKDRILYKYNQDQKSTFTHKSFQELFEPTL